MRVFVINAGVKRPDGSGGWLNAEMTRMAKEAFERRKIESIITDLNEKWDLEKEVEKVYQAVLDAGWDGEWFLRAYDDFGKKMGSHECKEGKIFIEPQGFAVMGGCGKETGADLKALESVDKWLNSEHGLSLNQPAFTKYYIEYGEISTYPAP